MGYRSDVGLVMTKTAVDKLKQKLTEWNSPLRQTILTLLGEETSEHHKYSTGEELWLWEGIKWYDTYQEVQALEVFLGGLASEEYLFIRIGEELDDVETDGTFWENTPQMAISRSIEFLQPTMEH